MSGIEFVELAFAHVGLDWQEHVTIDPRYFRPAEVDHLQADASKARARLNWSPSVDFRQLVRIMVDADLLELERKLAGGAQAVRAAAVSDSPAWLVPQDSNVLQSGVYVHD